MVAAWRSALGHFSDGAGGSRDSNQDAGAGCCKAQREPARQRGTAPSNCTLTFQSCMPAAYLQKETFEKGITGPEGHSVSRPAYLEVRT